MLKTELDVLQFWDDNSVFEKSLAQNKNKPAFVFLDGPPFANGTPHWGHIFISQVKDTVLRYYTQKGYYVPRRWGWDCHGVPVESKIEKQFKITDKRQIEADIGIEEFNRACRSIIMENDALWRTTIRRIGRWVDMDDQYRTMDNEFAESVWWGLGQLWNKELLYKGYRISLYSPSLGIPLSHTDVAMEVKYVNETIETPFVRFEASKEGWSTIKNTVATAVNQQLSEQTQLLKQMHKELQSVQRKETVKKISFAFTVKPDQSEANLPGEMLSDLEIGEAKERVEIVEQNIKTLQRIEQTLSLEAPLNLLAWTTTPWTLPANTCIAVGAETNYSIFYLAATAEFVLVADNRAIPVISLHFQNEVLNTPELKEKLENARDSGEYFTSLGLDIIKLVTLQGSDLEGLEYKPLFKLTKKIKEYEKKAGLFKVYTADFVTDSDGTGLVHIAPYGEDDFAMIKERNLPFVIVLNEHGEMLADLDEELSPVFGKKNEASNPLIIKILDKNDRLFATLRHSHRVPLFDRDGKKVFYAPQEGWFIAETKIKDQSLALNEKITWHPESLKYGRFGKGLETAPDWSISRNRYWGNPLPIWQNKQKTQTIFINSIEELAQKAVNPFFRLINTRDLNPELYSQYKTVIFGDSQSKLPLGINASQYRSKNLFELRQQKEEGIEKFSQFSQKMLEEIMELFDKYSVVQLMFTEDERRLWTTWLYELHPNSKKIAPIFYFFKKVRFDYDEYVAVGGLVPFDVHRPYIDEIILKDEVNQYYTRIPEVLDCWVESGSMPWASLHYPFENKDIMEQNHPADWIIEAQDQTRGWFRVLHVLSSGIFGDTAFKDVTCSGLILAQDGSKMSKSKKNYAEPEINIEKYGADAVRLYLMSSGLLNAESVSFRDRDLENVFKASTLLISNITKYAEYLNDLAHEHKPGQKLKEGHLEHPLNTWWYGYTKKTMTQVYEYMDAYNLIDAARLCIPYLDTLSTWYIRRLKDMPTEWLHESNACLRETLKMFAITFASLQPFNTEKVYSVVQDDKTALSVHLTSILQISALSTRERSALSDMEALRDLVSIVHNYRKEKNIRVRQPMYCDTAEMTMSPLLLDILLQECNLLPKSLSKIEGSLWKQQSVFGNLIVDEVIDTELAALGFARDFERSIQEFRKKKGFVPNQQVALTIYLSPHVDNIVVNSTLAQVQWRKLMIEVTMSPDKLVDNFETIEVKNFSKIEIKLDI